MYRIELTPGEVTVFRTIEELATGVRNGLITPKARIYHSASDKWLPIEFHPHYKQALDLNSGHTGDAGGHKHGSAGSKPASSKQTSPKSGSKPSKAGFTFLNVPISPVTPAPKPKSKPRVADLPYIQDQPAAAQPPAARPSQDHSPSDDQSPSHAQRPSQAASPSPDASPSHDQLPSRDPSPAPDHSPSPEPAPSQGHAPSHDPAEDHPSIEHSPSYDASIDSAPPGPASADQVPPARDATAHDPTIDHRSADQGAPTDDAPIEHSPAYDLGPPSWEQPPAHYAPPVEHTPSYEAAPAHRQPFKPMLADETPLYRSPAERSATDEAEAHAAFEAHLPPEPVRIEEPILDGPRSRFAVEELFAPPAPPAPSLPPVSASPVLELPTIIYPELTPLEPPVAEPSSGGSRARRTLHLVGTVMLLAAGGYASTTVFTFGRDDSGLSAASTMTDRAVVPVRTTAPASAAAPSPSAGGEMPASPTSSAHGRAESPHALSKVPSTPAGEPLAAASAPGAAEAPLPPASSGFAPALEPRAIVTVPLTPTPKPDAGTDSNAVAPTIDMQVTVPDLQGAEAPGGPPRQKGDSAMKRILKAVSGKKDAP